MAIGAVARDPRRLPRVAWLMGPKAKEHPENIRRVREVFEGHGLVDGRDISIEFAALADGKAAEDQVRRIVAGRPEVISGGMYMNLYVPLLAQLTHEIPIVFDNWPTDPAACGLVQSLRRPGGNLTGTAHVLSMPSMMWLAKEFDRSMRVIGNLGNGTREEIEDFRARGWGRQLACQDRIAQDFAARNGVELRPIELRNDATAFEIEEAVRKSGAQALIGVPEAEAFFEFERRSKIPAIGFLFRNVRKGLLVGVSFEQEEGVTEAIAMVARIVRGEKPGEIPIYRHMRYAIAVNLRTAASAGIRIPDSILIRAVEIVR